VTKTFQYTEEVQVEANTAEAAKDAAMNMNTTRK
jgi:hypothetical protein